jgi:4-amino-4-deoxy-L-arabinose transferase-like glycosyltransferase
MRPWRGWSGARFQRALALALVPASLAVMALHCAISPEVPFLRADVGAPWWMAPTQVSAILEQWGAEGTAVTRFAREIELRGRPARAAIAVRALRDFTLRVNGEVPPGGRSDGADWRRPRRLEVAALLREGANHIEVDVSNRRGPALVSVRGDGIDVGGAAAWQTFMDGVPLGAAIPADDTRPNPNAFAVETPVEGLLASRDALIGLFVAGVAGMALASRRLAPRWIASLPGAALGVAALAWVWLFAAKAVKLPLLVGFDARAHLEYVDFLREHAALPIATDGWSMYHPPLFYLLTALLQGVGDRAMKVVPWIAGLGLVFVAHSLAGRVYRGEPRVAALAVVFAAVLPVNLYSAAYFSNETLHALLAGLALLATVDALAAPRSTPRQALAIGLWLGLAALAKFTVLAVVPVAIAFLAAKLWWVERAPPARILARVAACAAVFAAVAGWFYARNQLHFGTPVVGNWALPGADQDWWQQPGFHTAAYYTGFGESLRHPYLAGFTSFWDGVYSTLWGDGYIAGRVYPHERHPLWSYDFMSAGYLLALPLTALLVVGIACAARDALRDPDPGRRAALSFLLTASYAVGFAFLFLTLQLPYFAQAKAPYALCLVPVGSVCFARGAARVDDWLARPGRFGLRIAFAGLLTAALGCCFLGFAA